MEYELLQDAAESIVRKYFTDDEWEEMPDILKTRHINAYLHYTTIPNADQFMPVPEFMKKSKELVNYKAGILKPTTSKVKEKEEKKRDREFRLPKSLLGSSPKKIRVNPKRSATNKVNYFDPEVPNDDRYIYCDNCNQEYVDFCESCGMLISVKDTPITKGTPNRASKTAPSGTIEIKPSATHGQGAFACRRIPKGVQFGPYEGEICRVENTNGYSWKLKRGKLIDASDETISNWLRYVNCARHSSEQNVVAFQYEGGLYYRTFRDIDKGEELLVYYGESFARILGIDQRKYFDPEHCNIKRDYYCCKYCGLGLSMESYRDTHEKLCKFRPNRRGFLKKNEGFECQYCKCCLTNEEFKNAHEKKCSKKNKKHGETKRNAVNGKIKSFDCEECEYSTNNSANLRSHMLVHNKENAEMHYCNSCSFQTVRKSSLNMHKRIHENIGIFSCRFCSKNFNQKLHLNSHLFNNHKNEIDNMQEIITCKIHSCNFCSYKTIVSTNLYNHLLVHHNKSNTKKYVCDKCQYGTNFKSSLILHVRIHSNLKPFVCPSCTKGFNRKQHLDGHILNKHKDNKDLAKMITHKISKCPECLYNCIRLSNLKSHIKNNHTK